MDVTRLLKPGGNVFEFEMANSCRNLLGPHHRKDGGQSDVGPGSWDEVSTDEYSFVPTGFTSAPKLVFTKKGVETGV